MNTLLRNTRREFSQRASGGFGALALAGLWNELQAAPTDPLAARPGHFPAMAFGIFGARKSGAHCFRRDAENHPPEACAPRNTTAPPVAILEFGFNQSFVRLTLPVGNRGEAILWLRAGASG